jgi:uracil-DNA glycosylase family 4
MNFEEFQEKLRNCRYCKEKLHLSFEPKPLVWGNQKAKIVQISQAPSLHASIFGRPFSRDEDMPDASGKQLLKWYDISKEVFYNPNIFYITAVAHCFPGKNKSGDAKPPTECAKKWLWQELSYLNPKLFLVIGRYAADFIFPGKNFTELVFTNQTLLSKPAFVLPHPSPANKKWLKDHPEFERKRLKEIRIAIHKIIKS